MRSLTVAPNSEFETPALAISFPARHLSNKLQVWHLGARPLTQKQTGVHRSSVVLGKLFLVLLFLCVSWFHVLSVDFMTERIIQHFTLLWMWDIRRKLWIRKWKSGRGCYAAVLSCGSMSGLPCYEGKWEGAAGEMFASWDEYVWAEGKMLADVTVGLSSSSLPVGQEDRDGSLSAGLWLDPSP